VFHSLQSAHNRDAYRFIGANLAVQPLFLALTFTSGTESSVTNTINPGSAGPASAPASGGTADPSATPPLVNPHPALHNEDLAPATASQKRWGWFEIFNVWTNDVQSLAGYTLAASLFIGAGINGWFVFAAIILAGVFVNWLVNLSGAPSVRHGVPYAVMARPSMGVLGARFPAMIRGVVAIFWYGAQTYFASTAVALAFNAALGSPESGTFLGLNVIGWISYVIVAVIQVWLPDGPYYYKRGWNIRAIAAFGIAAIFAVLTVWLPALAGLAGFAWIIGAALGGLFYWVAMHGQAAPAPRATQA